MPEQPQDFFAAGLSLQFLHCAGLLEMFTLAATLPGKQHGKEQEVMFQNSVCYLIQSPFSIAEVGGSSRVFCKEILLGNHFNKAG